jgi:hypothetical protein
MLNCFFHRGATAATHHRRQADLEDALTRPTGCETPGGVSVRPHTPRADDATHEHDPTSLLSEIQRLKAENERLSHDHETERMLEANASLRLRNASRRSSSFEPSTMPAIAVRDDDASDGDNDNDLGNGDRRRSRGGGDGTSPREVTAAATASQRRTATGAMAATEAPPATAAAEAPPLPQSPAVLASSPIVPPPPPAASPPPPLLPPPPRSPTPSPPTTRRVDAVLAATPAKEPAYTSLADEMEAAAAEAESAKQVRCGMVDVGAVTWSGGVRCRGGEA